MFRLLTMGVVIACCSFSSTTKANELLNNHPPVVDAGPDFEVDASQQTFDLSGTATDPDQDEMMFMWYQLTGPVRVKQTNASSLTTTASRFVPGTYIFRLFAADTSRAYGHDDVTVVVR
jgi:hypothetical protein